jgi:hypothetical protein
MAAEIPADLVAWFEGKSTLAEAFGLPRLEMRWRVIEVLAIHGEPDEPYIVRGKIAEFKTYVAAERRRDRWASSGRTVIVQVAPVLWLTNNELPESAVVT